MARARPSNANAIFDCKVLSRNHALIWYETGKFYLQDTKSSNGTFVNNQRLSKGSEESLPREVCSGDILQFGVDVMENSRQVTHGCIIATLKLYLPDGKEAKASPTIMSSPVNGHLPPQDLYMLNQYIQEALAREQLLETKLAILQRLVNQTEVASGSAWKSLIDEDRLLTRVEILESQLSVYSKSMTDDKLREETKRLMEEKEEYQEVAKSTLRKIANDKLEAIKSAKELEKQLSVAEDEANVLREHCDRVVDDNKKLAEELGNLSLELEAANKKVNEQEQKQLQEVEEASKVEEVESVAVDKEEVNKNEDGKEVSTTEEMKELQLKCAALENENKVLSAQLTLKATSIEECYAEASTNTSDTHNETVEHLDTSKDDLVNVASALERSLLEKSDLEKEVEELKERERSLLSTSQEVEDKNVQLIKYKEKCSEINEEKALMETSLKELEKQVESLSMQSQTATACAMVPLGILLLAFIIAYLPTLSTLFGTADEVN